MCCVWCVRSKLRSLKRINEESWPEGLWINSPPVPQVDAQLAPMNKSQLADLIADELVAEAKAEEATLVQKWSSLVADVAVCAKLSPQDSVDDAGLASAIASAVGATLAPDTENEFEGPQSQRVNSFLVGHLQARNGLGVDSMSSL